MRDSELELALSNLAGEGGEFVPEPLANFFCKKIWDGSDLLQMIPTIPMTSKTLTIPAITSRLKVYWQTLEKGEVPRSAFTSASQQLDAKTWMAWVDVSDQLVEDAAAGPFSIANILADEYAAAFRYYLEMAIVLGDVSHSPTSTTDQTNAAEGWWQNGTWYSRDPRLMWNGILTLAMASGQQFAAATANAALAFTNDDVQANTTSPSRMSPMVVDYAVWALGRYARRAVVNKGGLIFITNPCSYMQLKNAMQVRTVDKFGPDGTIKTGEIPSVSGVPIIECPFMTEGNSVLTYRTNLIYGNRRGMKVEDERVPRELGSNKVVSQRGDFTVCHDDALVWVTDLDTCTQAS